jgi:hypothetical protein
LSETLVLSRSPCFRFIFSTLWDLKLIVVLRYVFFSLSLLCAETLSTCGYSCVQAFSRLAWRCHSNRRFVSCLVVTLLALIVLSLFIIFCFS